MESSHQDQHDENEKVEEMEEAETFFASVYLPRFLSSEFGISESVARNEILIGSITIDGELWNKSLIDREYIPVEVIKGKRVTVQGETRSYSFEYHD